MEVSETIRVLILAVVQGIAEFLPISSSGHILVGARLLGDSGDVLDLSIALHFGTLLSILVVYWKQIVGMLTSQRRLIPLLVLGTLPAAAVGLYVKRNHADVLNDPMLAGISFVVTGILLVSLTTMRRGTQDYPTVRWRQALVIGLFQMVALLPGVSRSGATIVGGSYVGLRQSSAATFSFLLAIPAILGASLVEGRDLLVDGTSTPYWLLAVGAGVSFLVGIVALKILMRMIEVGKLHWFAYYVIPLGLAVLAWQCWLEFNPVPTTGPGA